MFTSEYFVVFPEGDAQEIPGRLPINAVVDINGSPLSLPLPTNRIIAFRVVKIKTDEHRGGSETYHFLELLSADELRAYTSGGLR